jgi:hypothetical protein
MFFLLLFDCQYNAETQWWAREAKRVPHQIAAYLHWVERTGDGLVESHSGMDKANWDRLGKKFPDVCSCLETWRKKGREIARGHRHVSGKDPAWKVDVVEDQGIPESIGGGEVILREFAHGLGPFNTKNILQVLREDITSGKLTLPSDHDAAMAVLDERVKALRQE